MNRSPAWLLVVCLLALTTSLALLRASAFVTPPPLAPPSSNVTATSQVALVHRFYAAVNTALRTGESSMLESLVADDLIEHPAPMGTASGRIALIQRLLALRSMYPDLHLVIDDLQATDANQVTARIQTTGTAPSAYLGLPVPVGVPVWPSLEEVRLDGEQIVERWAGSDAAVQLEPLFATTRPVPTTGTAYLQVARVTYPPHSTVPLGTEQTPRLTYLEAGTVTVPDTRWAGSNPETWGNTIAATAGMLLPAAPGLSAMVREDEAAVVLEVIILDELPDRTHPIPERTVNVEATVLARAVVAVPAWPGMEVAVGQVSVAPGATVAFPPASGPILLVVESGDLGLTAKAGQVAVSGTWVVDSTVNRGPIDDSDSTGGSVAAQNQAPFSSGETALVEANEHSLWHNPGSQPATILVLVLAPSGEGSPTNSTTPTTAHL